MRIRSLAIFFFLILVSGASSTVAQCDCMGAAEDIRGTGYSSAYEEFKHADAVFYGQVVQMKMIDRKPIRAGANNYELEIKFRVEKAWRRDLDQYITIREYSDGCIIGFDIAARWLVYAEYDDDKNLRTGYCTRTRIVYKNVEKDFKEFEQHGEKQTKIIKAAEKQ
jgi:hypothetical protein